MATRLILIQARMTSSRLPGKVLLPLAGEPLLRRMIDRITAANVDALTVLITSREAADDAIESFATEHAIPCFRGHLTDLLDRHYQAAQQFDASIIAKIPSDCPLIDPQVIERAFATFDMGDYDYVSNLHPASYPDGNDVEIFTREALESAWKEADKDFEREHTTPFIWERPERFKIGNVAWHCDYSMSHRWTIDYPEDYEFISAVYDELWTSERPLFSLKDILDLLERKPSIAALNAKYAGVNWYRKHLGSLRTISLTQTKLLEGEEV